MQTRLGSLRRATKILAWCLASTHQAARVRDLLAHCYHKVVCSRQPCVRVVSTDEEGVRRKGQRSLRGMAQHLDVTLLVQKLCSTCKVVHGGCERTGCRYVICGSNYKIADPEMQDIAAISASETHVMTGPCTCCCGLDISTLAWMHVSESLPLTNTDPLKQFCAGWQVLGQRPAMPVHS